jgi:hypothetical protein
MMKEVEKMSKLNTDDRTVLQNIQEGLSGVKPIDDKWINMVIDALKSKPDLFKTLFKGKGAMLGGVSDEQIDGFIDMGSRMEKWLLKIIAYAIWYLTSAAKPIAAGYKVADEYSYGTAKYILMGIVGIAFYYFSMFVLFIVKWFIFRVYNLITLLMTLFTGKKAVSTVTETVSSSGGVIDEFANAAASTISKVASAAASATLGSKMSSNNAGGSSNQQQAGSSSSKTKDEFEF